MATVSKFVTQYCGRVELIYLGRGQLEEDGVGLGLGSLATFDEPIPQHLLTPHLKDKNSNIKTSIIILKFQQKNITIISISVLRSRSRHLKSGSAADILGSEPRAGVRQLRLHLLGKQKRKALSCAKHDLREIDKGKYDQKTCIMHTGNN